MNNEINGTWPSSSSFHLSKNRTSSRALLVPDFLTKTFKIVTDPSTNSIISWARSGESFIIWDHIKFSVEILPKYFKHSNLSSFVYQLNNYCFRKIGVDHQWEYENPNFQAGKEYLLTSITKRGQNGEMTIRINPSHRNINKNAVEIKTNMLKNGINESKMEIEKLKARHSRMESHVKKFESELRKSEGKSRRMRACWAAACEEIFKMSKNNNNNNIVFGDDEVKRKRKIEGNDNNVADYEFLKRMILQEDDDDDDDDVVVCGNEGGSEMADKQAKIAKDLEGLIANMVDQDGN
ncbi:heat Stress Transcription Factor family protein [Striga asiatica]|uniref:Heat Stress Transcription Factor family protein n=1 Tax=Striga asiatica TaxID=4170 RepID=A0A5A7PGF2_STRAF|nr:heat Stress Transcription Factor family protein [Striga asiatica]